MAAGRKIDSSEERRDNDRRRLCVRIFGGVADLEGVRIPVHYVYLHQLCECRWQIDHLGAARTDA